jgi:hypothetical protein
VLLLAIPVLQALVASSGEHVAHGARRTVQRIDARVVSHTLFVHAIVALFAVRRDQTVHAEAVDRVANGLVLWCVHTVQTVGARHGLYAFAVFAEPSRLTIDIQETVHAEIGERMAILIVVCAVLIGLAVIAIGIRV